MNFKNKIILFIIISVLLIVGLLASFLYSQGKYNFFNNFSEKNKLELKAECLEKLDKMNDEEFIEEINNLDILKEKLIAVKLNMVKYLGCQSNGEREEFDKHVYTELANRILKLIDKLDFPDEETKIIIEKLSLIKMFYQDDEKTLLDEKYTIINDVALGPIKAICFDEKESDYFLEICSNASGLLTERRDELSLEEVEIIESMCNNFCENINKYSNNQSDYELDMNNLIWPEDDLIKRKRFRMISAFAFQVGGEELALKFCDFIKNESLEGYEECKSYINSLKYINCKDFGFNENKNCNINKYDKCEYLRKKANDLVCELDLINYIK